MSPLTLSVVIPTRDTRDLTLQCLEAVEANRPDEVILVDDGSRDRTEETVRRRFPRARLLRVATSEGFTRAANRGLREAGGDVLVLLNSDTEVSPGSLEVVREAMASDLTLGIAGAKLTFLDGERQWSGGREPTWPWLFALASGLPGLMASLPGFRSARPVSGWRTRDLSVDWVTGAAMAIRREVWERCGPLDEAFSFYCQDLDLCLEARDAGWDVRILPTFMVAHHGGGTISRSSGSVSSADPALLWGDLIRWSEKRHGIESARRAAWALRTGGRLRVLGRRLRGPLMSAGARAEWRRGTRAYSLALASISHFGRKEAA